MYTLKILISPFQICTHLAICIRHVNALRSRSWVFIFTLNHTYHDQIPFRRHFHYHPVCSATKRRYKKWHFDNVQITKTTKIFDLDSWSINFIRYFPIDRKTSHFWHCQSKKTTCDAFVCVSLFILFRDLWRKRWFIKLWFLTC